MKHEKLVIFCAYLLPSFNHYLLKPLHTLAATGWSLHTRGQVLN